jgi:hypothetical protein
METGSVNSPSKTSRFAAPLIAAALILGATDARAQLLLNHWEFGRTIGTQAAGRPVAVPLPADVLAASDAGLKDLRIVSSDGAETPYAIHTQTVSKKETPVPVEVVSRTSDLESSFLTVSLGPEPRAFNRVAVVPEETNFLREIDIEGSADGKSWKTIRQGILIYAFASEGRYSYLAQVTGEIYSGYGTVSVREENLGMRVPESRYRFVRVRIPHDKDKEPVGIREVKLAFAEESPAKETTYAAKLASESSDEPKSTAAVMDLGSARLPIRRISFDIPEKNFYRQVKLYTREEEGEEWASAGSGSVYSIDLEGAGDRRLEIEVPETRARYVKAVVFHGDNRPVTIAGAKAYGLTRHLVFIPEKGKTYRLLYGHPGAQRPSYDVGMLLRDKTVDRYPQASLGPAERNPDFVRHSGKPWTEERPYLLWGSMAAIGLALLFLAVRVMKKI